MRTLVIIVLHFMVFHATQIFAENVTSTDSIFPDPATTVASLKFMGGTLTNFGYGGPALKFTRFNNQFGLMTGGRGAATIN